MINRYLNTYLYFTDNNFENKSKFMLNLSMKIIRILTSKKKYNLILKLKITSEKCKFEY